MDDSSLLFSLLYILFCAILIFPPIEFVSAGVTIECAFGRWLGSEYERFIDYHFRRIVVTIIIHSLLPIGYLLGIAWMQEENPFHMYVEGTWIWKLFVICSVAAPVVVLCGTGLLPPLHSNHPIPKKLTVFCNPNTNWTSIASDINLEFRRVDKISIQINSIIRIVVTDSWIMKLTPFGFDCASQDESVLVLHSSDTHQMVPNSPTGAQYLNIEVKSTRAGVKTFNIRLNALDFQDLQDKLLRPVVVLPNVSFHRTLMDKFLDAFREQVALNPVVEAPMEVDMCMGCMLTPANVDLRKLCPDDVAAASSDRCSACRCRPLWCLDCMCKWFASRQDQARPDTWLESRCTCPVCRAQFCIRDVCSVRQR